VLVLLGPDVEALGVAGEADGGDDGARAALVVDGVPVDGGEEGVLLDAGGAARDVAQPARAVDGAQLPDDVLRGGADGRLARKDDGFFDDSVGRKKREDGI
jgi:hypothetical protein